MSEFREKLKYKTIRIKKGPGRKAQWGRLTGQVSIDESGREIYWAERHIQGGQIPLYREDFVIKRKQKSMRFSEQKPTGKVNKGIVRDRGRTRKDQ
jgi:hypothetical protein